MGRIGYSELKEAQIGDYRSHEVAVGKVEVGR